MKRIMHLIFCTTFVMGLSGETSYGTQGIFCEQGGDEQGDTDSGKGFQESIQLGLFESIYKSVYTKKTTEDMFLSITGEKLDEKAKASTSANKTVKLLARFEAKKEYPVIPNINALKDSWKEPVEGFNLDVIHIPEGTSYQEANFSPLKGLIAGIFTAAVLGTAGLIYTNKLSFTFNGKKEGSNS